MKHFINKDNEIYAFEEDGSQDYLITEDMVRLSDDEFQQLTNPKNIDLLKQELNKLKYTYELLYKEPNEFNNIAYTGGFDSASRLLSKIQCNKLLELDSLVFTSADDIDITLTLQDATDLYLSIVLEYERKRQEYKEKSRELKLQYKDV